MASMIERVKKLMYKPENIRNIGIAAHVDHGKTTLSDNLIAGAGMMSEDLAGKQLVLDFLEEEKQRGITIQSANVSMVHEYEGQDYLINLIDTPGHVDFGGEVTRAMRAVDGAVVVVCAVEGAMPQTETVLRQALRERVKPILFINKVDRLIKELRLTPEQMMERFMQHINKVNELIEKFAPEEYKEKWKVTVQDGRVIFGSAYHNWALSVPFMQKTGVTFKEIIDLTLADKNKELRQKAPLHKVLLDAVIKHLPSPIEAQKYRIPRIWPGDINSEDGKALLNCDPKGPLAVVITKIMIDKHAGEVAYGRVYSGTIKQGQEVIILPEGIKAKVQQVGVAKGPQRIQVDEVPAGNIVSLVGLKGVKVGDTITNKKDFTPFEQISHIFDPVVTKAVEAKNPADLSKLVEVLKKIAKEDPSLKVEINEETGQHLISGMGELHLEIIENRIKRDFGLDIITSPPIVVYRETIESPSEIAVGRSPNKHNDFFIKVEPIEDNIYELIRKGELKEGRVKQKEVDNVAKLLTNAGMDYDEAKRLKEVYKDNMFFDMTRGIVQINEVIELVMDGFEQVMDKGPLAGEPVFKVKVKLVDAKLHEDAIHRGPGQVYPAVRDAIREAMNQVGVVLYEPVMIIQIDAPQDYMGPIMTLLQNRRGQVLDMQQEEETMIIIAKLPVAESFGFTAELRSATGGRGVWFVKEQIYEKVPRELLDKVVKEIRQRKGLE